MVLLAAVQNYTKIVIPLWITIFLLTNLPNFSYDCSMKEYFLIPDFGNTQNYMYVFHFLANNNINFIIHCIIAIIYNKMIKYFKLRLDKVYGRLLLFFFIIHSF